MDTELLEIHPRELTFVKTTSPKKYCVRPNIGIIKPISTCDFTEILKRCWALREELEDLKLAGFKSPCVQEG
ncbi:hypothetical protein QQ045_002365 [Rhodiola kirilowii]